MPTGTLLYLLQQASAADSAGGASLRRAGATAAMGQLFRFLFTSVPQWVQIGGIAIGVPAAIVIAWWFWKHRREVWQWWLTRTRAAQVALLLTIMVIGTTALASGLYGYNYMMHDNDFCQSCHVMDTAWDRFQVSAHKKIQCHDCHQQPLYVSTKELFWWVYERRMTIPPHDKVPNAICNSCHMREGSDSTLRLVTLTAGHALHLRSDSSALKNVQCVSCHGRDFHKFKPTNFACAQSGCHNDIRVNLGAMSQKGFLHCTSCHDFKGRVPGDIPVAKAKLALVPKAMDCSSCHSMEQKIDRFDLVADPHKGNCGMCHDVHKQTEPKSAFKTCATANCHSNADTLTAFHRGLGKHAIDQCGACHQAHSWKVKGSDCISCHQDIYKDRPAAKRASVPGKPIVMGRSSHGGRFRQRAARLARFVRSAPPAPQQDEAFPHSRHKSLACTACHATSDTHGGLRFSRPQGCQACHHSPRQAASCNACHDATARGPRAMPVKFAITPKRDPVTRPLTFAHSRHAAVECRSCHANNLNRSVTTTCQGCHAEHHTAKADCASCHPTAREGHDRLAHVGCESCHADAKVAAISTSRVVCLACHQEQRSHYPAGDCATCHALASHGVGAALKREGAR